MWTPKSFTSPSLGLRPSNPAKPQVSATALSSYPDDIKSYLTPQPQTQNDASLKRQILIYAIVFIALEASFLVLAYYCLFRPIPLHKTPGDGQFQLLSIHNVTAEEVKSGVTAVSVVWHTLAGLFVKDIINIICSAEFMAQYLQYRSLRPRKTDRVSRVTSGLIDQISHFLTPSASREYRLTFVIVLVIMTLGPLGSSTITTGSMFLTSGMDFRVAYLADMPDPVTTSSNSEIELSLQAAFISRVETLHQQLSFGFETRSENTLIPWPRDRLTDLPEFSTLTYQSDIARYKLACSWKRGSFVRVVNGSSSFDAFEMEGKLYGVREGLASIRALPSIIPLGQISPSGHIVQTSPTVFAFLTNGKPILPNTTIATAFKTPVLGTLNLTNIPSFLVSNSSIGALLVCNPQISILPAEVTVSRRFLLTANPIPGWGEPNSSVPLIGNFAYSAAMRIIPEVFAKTLGASDLQFFPKRFNVQSLNTFLTNDSNARQLPTQLTSLYPLPLDTIGQNLDRLVQIPAKIYLMGYQAITLKNATELALRASHGTATLRFPVTALLSSKPFLVALTIVDGLIAVVLLALLWSVSRERALYLFDLENLTEVLCQERGNPGNIDSGK